MSDETQTAADRLERLVNALYQIQQWGDAYPREVFPEPDAAYYRRAREVLTANGMTLDGLAAVYMRHAISGAAKIAREALK